MGATVPGPHKDWLPPGCVFNRWVPPWSLSRCSLTEADVADVAEYTYRWLTHTANHPDWVPGGGPIDVHLRDQVLGAPTLDEAERRLRDHLAHRAEENGKKRPVHGGSYGPLSDITYTDRGILVAYRDVEFAPLEPGEWRHEFVRCELLRAGFVAWREIAAWARREAGIVDAPRPLREMAVWPDAGYAQLDLFGAAT